MPAAPTIISGSGSAASRRYGVATRTVNKRRIVPMRLLLHRASGIVLAQTHKGAPFITMTDAPDNDSYWDSLCKQCGLCCFEKLENERGTIFYTQTPCRYLDVNSRRCKVFERRFEINPGCVKLTSELVPALHWLPRDCGYLQQASRLPDEPRRGKGRRGKSRKRKKNLR